MKGLPLSFRQYPQTPIVFISSPASFPSAAVRRLDNFTGSHNQRRRPQMKMLFGGSPQRERQTHAGHYWLSPQKTAAASGAQDSLKVSLHKCEGDYHIRDQDSGL